MRLLLLATFALIAIASFAPGARLWGLNHLAFYSVGVRVLALAVIAAGLIPAVADAVAQRARTLAHAMVPRRRMVATLTALVCFGLFIALPSATFLLGDTNYIATNARDAAAADATTFRASLRHLHHVFPGMDFLYSCTARLAGRVFHLDPLAGVRVPVALIGAAFVFALVSWLLRPRTSSVDRLMVLLLATSGAVVLLFGYVEVYVPFIAALVLYMIAAYNTLHRGGALWKPAVCLLLASVLHAMGLLLLPSLLWLALFAARSRTASPRLSAIARWACIAMVPLPWLARFVPGLTRFIRPLAGDGAALGSMHLADVANLLFLVCPAIVVLVGVVVWNRFGIAREQRVKAAPAIDRADEAFSALVAVPLLLFLVAIRSDLGVARDWDLFAPCGLAALPLARLGLQRVPANTISDRHTASLVILCATVTCAWVGLNASGPRSVARYRTILAYDTPQFLDAGYAYELLASYARQRNDVRGEIDALEHAVAVSDNPRYRLTLGMRYYAAGDKEHGIELVERSLRSTPTDGRTRQMLVQMLYFAGKMDELERVCDDGIRLEPSQPLYYFLKGRVLANAGKTQEALDVLRRARALNPSGKLGSDIDELIRFLESSP